MDERAVDEAAAIFARNRLSPGPLPGLPDTGHPADEAEGYAIQRRLHARLSEAGLGRIAGQKIGCTTPVMQRFLNIDQPCAGAVFERTVHECVGRFRRADFHHVGVECEIAVRLDRDLAEAPFTRADVANAVVACMAAIEVVDDRYRDYRLLDAPTLIGDNFFNAGCVLGPPVTIWRQLDLPALGGTMTINGQSVGSGRGGDILGHPLDALAWLANLRAGQGEALTAGSFVLLGSVVQTKWVEAGDVVEIAIDGLGTARAEFA